MKQTIFPDAYYSFITLSEAARSDLWHDLSLLYPNCEATEHAAGEAGTALLSVTFPDFPPACHGDLMNRLRDKPIFYKTPIMRDFVQVVTKPVKVTA